MKLEILQLISHKLDMLGTTYDEFDIKVALDEIDQTIKNYCHIDCIPDGLLYVRANMVVDYIRYMEANKPKEDASVDVGGTTELGPLTEIKSGDVSYKFADKSTSKANIGNAHTTDLDTITMNYEHQLNNFRRVSW